jgi:hypothetical protein
MRTGTFQLALLSLHPSIAPSDAVATIARLQDAGSLDVAGMVFVESGLDGKPLVRQVHESRYDNGDVDPAGWQRFLVEVAERTTPAASRRLSRTFVAELRSLVLASGSSALALLLSGLDAGAVVAEFSGSSGTRLVYGAVPDELVTTLLRHWRPAVT